MDSKRKIVELDITTILPNRFQPRIAFDDAGLNELTESIKNHGVIQPIIVRKLGEKFEIIAGERRYKASILAGLKTIPAIITDFNDKQSSEIALIENVQRRDLTPIEEAISYKRILDMNYLTQDELAKKLGKTQSTIANKLRLLNLCDEVQEALLFGKISERHARSLLKLKSSDQQKIMLNRIIDERLTVRRTDEEIDIMFRKNENQKENLNIPTSDIIGDEVNEVVDNNQTSSGVDMLYNQATMNIPKIMGEDIQAYEESQNNSQPILNSPVEELHFGFEDNNNDINNPGFMDISNIESNAKDIFNETPVRPFYFSEPEQPSTPVVPEEQFEEVTPVVEENRTPLINPMFMNNQEEEEEETVQETVPVMPVSNNSTDFDFDFIPAETVNTNTVAIPDLSELEQFGHFEQPVVETPVAPETPVVEETIETPVQEVPVVETTAIEEPEVLSFDTPEVTEQPVVEDVVIPEVPVVPSYEEGTPVVETPVVEVNPSIEETVVMPTEEETPVVEEKKEEKKSFFDKLKSLVDSKPEKLEEPVVETESPIIETPVVEETIETPVQEVPVVETLTMEEPEVLSFDTPEVTEQPIVEDVVIPETPVVPSYEEVTPVVETPFVEVNPTIEETVITPVEVEEPEILSFDTPEVTEQPIENVVENISSVEPEMITFDNPNVEEVISTEENNVQSEQIVPDFNYVMNDNPTMQHNIASPFNNTIDVAENNIGETINDLDESVNEMNNLVDSIDSTPTVYDEVEKVDEIPSDILNTLDNTVETPSSLDEIANSDLDNTIDMPADLAEIVSNPDLTNNFVDNETVETPVVEDVVETPVQEPTDYSMPFQTILDNVEVSDDTVVTDTPVVPSYEEVTPVVETPVQEVQFNQDETPEFTEFVPESLPIDDEDQTSGEDLTVPLYQPIYEDETPVKPIYDDTPTTNMGEAMKVIREATRQLQELGFIVDTEEFDLEDVYQVMFKINKNRK